jgi:SAM-dependent methyltransferase
MTVLENRSQDAAAAADVRCPLTGAAARPWLHVPCDWRRPDVPAAWDLFWCDASGLGFVHPRPRKEDVADFYRVAYYTHETAAEEGRGKLVDRVLRKLAWRADQGVPLDDAWLQSHLGTARRRVLDIGCGNGDLLARIKALGHDVIGVEPDPEAREVCKSQGLTVHPGHGEAMPLALLGARFEFVFLSHVLEHTLDPLAVLAVARDKLIPSGTLVVEVPNNAARGLAAAGIAWPWLDVPRHLTFFTTKSLLLALERAGFELLATEYVGYARQFERWWLEDEQRAWDAYARAGARQRRRPTRWSSWHLLRSTKKARDEEKYDAVRAVARRV